MGAAACLILKKPVLLQYDRNADMEILGARPAVQSSFRIGCQPDCKITSFDVDTKQDVGVFEALEMAAFKTSSMNAYAIAGANLKCSSVKSSKATCTIMRAPGHF